MSAAHLPHRKEIQEKKMKSSLLSAVRASVSGFSSQSASAAAGFAREREREFPNDDADVSQDGRCCCCYKRPSIHSPFVPISLPLLPACGLTTAAESERRGGGGREAIYIEKKDVRI